MKAKIYLGCLLALSLTTTSCSDFLTEDPKGRLSEENYPKDPQDVEGSVNAMFATINEVCAGTHAYAHAWMGDDITTIAGGNKDVFRQYDIFSVNDNNGDTRQGWKGNYRIVKAANFILSRVPQSNAPEEVKKVAMAQAYFWRAIAYFKLVRWYGEVPLILETPIDYKASKASVADIYKQIESDLEKAEQGAAESYSKEPMITEGLYNYANKGAVNAVQAAVFMAHAGYPLNGGNEYYAKAAAAAKKVIDGVKGGKYYYKLEPQYSQKYQYVSNNNSKEIVVGIKYSFENKKWGWDGLSTQMGVTQGFAVCNGWDDAIGELKFYNDMPAGPRKDVIYGKDGGKILITADEHPKKGQKVDWYSEDVVEKHPMFRSLMYGENADGQQVDYNSDLKMFVRGLTGQTIRLVSYDEVLLWYAEAKARSGSVDALAKDCLKQIAERAYGPGQHEVNVDALAADPAKFADRCMLEHGYEVAGYFPALVTRATDQLRMNELKKNFEVRAANQPVEIAGIKMTEPVEVTDKAWNDNRVYAPVPEFDAGLNPGLVDKK